MGDIRTGAEAPSAAVPPPAAAPPAAAVPSAAVPLPGADAAPRLDELIATVAFLRAPGGCPWDAEQTH